MTTLTTMTASPIASPLTSLPVHRTGANPLMSVVNAILTPDAVAPGINPDFVLAGHAIFTVSNGKGEHYTYRVDKKDNDDGRPPVWFVSLLTGPDNTEDYTYLGLLDVAMWRIRLTKKSRMTAESKPVKVFDWTLARVRDGQDGKMLPAGYKIHHEGKCGRCGRLLTVTESVISGLGPECAKAVKAGR